MTEAEEYREPALQALKEAGMTEECFGGNRTKAWAIMQKHTGADLALCQRVIGGILDTWNLRLVYGGGPPAKSQEQENKR